MKYLVIEIRPEGHFIVGMYAELQQAQKQASNWNKCCDYSYYVKPKEGTTDEILNRPITSN